MPDTVTPIRRRDRSSRDGDAARRLHHLETQIAAADAAFTETGRQIAQVKAAMADPQVGGWADYATEHSAKLDALLDEQGATLAELTAARDSLTAPVATNTLAA